MLSRRGHSGDTRELPARGTKLYTSGYAWIGSRDIVITDPPYADNVNYSELVRLLLCMAATHSRGRHTRPLRQSSRQKPMRSSLRKRVTVRWRISNGVLRMSSRNAGDLLPEHGLMVFTFHHEARHCLGSCSGVRDERRLFGHCCLPHRVGCEEERLDGCPEDAFLRPDPCLQKT